MKIINEVKLDFPSTSANEGFARGVAACFATQLDPTLEELGDIRTAVSEAVTNAIVHGYPDTLGKITLRMRIYEDNLLEVQVKDRGWGFPMWPRPGSPCSPPGERSAAAWASPSWRALWTPSG